MNRQVPQFSQAAPFVKRVTWGLFFVTLAIACLAFFTPGPVQRSAYMGAQYCAACHQEEYKAWANSPHARAHQSLPANKKNDPACLKCHATGVFEKNEAVLPGVQCEACHGPGEHYSNLHIKKDAVLSQRLFKEKPDEESCLHCHSVDSKLWSPKDNMKKIDHWSKARIKAEHGAGVTHKMAEIN